MAEQGYYRPPKSYWKEVRQLDTGIREVSRPASSLQQSDNRKRSRRRYAAWWGEYGTTCVWTWRGTGSISRLAIATLVNVDPVSEGLAVEDSSITSGLYGTDYTYSTSSILPKSMLLGYLLAPDISKDIRTPQSTRDLLRGIRSGVTVANIEDYQRLLNELRRGASNDYMIDQEDISAE